MLSIEEVKEAIKDAPEAVKQFYNDSFEYGGCQYKKDAIFVPIEELKALKGFEVFGAQFSIWYNKDLSIFVARDDKYGLRDWLNCGHMSILDTSFKEAVELAKKNARKCDYCGKYVSYEDIHQVGFAGKSCSACLADARKQDEYPGWYN